MSAPSHSTAARLANEREHHRRIAPRAEEIWNWASPAGRQRVGRRITEILALTGLTASARALELGCGTGVFLERTAVTGARVVGLDLSPDLLARARARLGGAPNVHLLCGDAERLPYPEASFDAVYGCSVLHHLELASALAEARRVLRPGGWAVFSEPNLLNPQIAFMFRVGPRRLFGLSDDEMAFTRFTARAALLQAGFESVSVEPFDFVHPAVPRFLVPLASSFGTLLEKAPGLREVGGSLLMRGRRP